jgi:hypothetical protein
MVQLTDSNNITLSSPSRLNPVRLEYTINGNSESIIEKNCELLVIACDPPGTCLKFVITRPKNALSLTS